MGKLRQTALILGEGPTEFFYFKNEGNLTLKPLHKAFKRGTSSSKWQQAYQAVKHDRINNLKKGNIGNLLLALGALYILNIYYRDTKFESVADKDASNIDWGLGSEIFSVKVSHESGGASNDKIYVKKSDYDECIYLVKLIILYLIWKRRRKKIQKRRN